MWDKLIVSWVLRRKKFWPTRWILIFILISASYNWRSNVLKKSLKQWLMVMRFFLLMRLSLMAKIKFKQLGVLWKLMSSYLKLQETGRELEWSEHSLTILDPQLFTSTKEFTITLMVSFCYCRTWWTRIRIRSWQSSGTTLPFTNQSRPRTSCLWITWNP